MASFWTKYRRNKQEVESLHHNCSETIENDANLTCQGGICYSDSNLDDSIECDSLDNLSSESSSIEEERDSFFSGDEEAPPDMPDLATELKLWSTNHKSSRQSVNDLLGVLRQYHPDLPKDARTLLGTPSGVNLETLDTGDFKYFGIETNIKRLLKLMPSLLKKDDIINLLFNIDGLPLFKSSLRQFWPILASFNNSPVFIVALYCGYSKPPSLDAYLKEFLLELKNITEHGFHYDRENYSVAVKAFTCDAPARAYLKGTVNHTGYYSCERCVIKGTYVKHRVVFNDQTTYPKRTFQEFKTYSYEKHQKHVTPLVDEDLDCINLFVLDYMHLVCLGTMKRMIKFLRSGPRDCKLSSKDINLISKKLVSLRAYIPSEFSRRPRSLLELDHWKATEFRQFLLYTGPVVLKKFLSEEMYVHFLSLSVAVSILLNQDKALRNKYVNFADKLLKFFANNSQFHYTETFCVYNIHNLTHLVDVISHDTSLNELSAFPFENFMQSLKKMVRSAHNPLAQVTKRLSEISEIIPKKKMSFLKVSTKQRDRCFLIENHTFVFIKSSNQDGYLCDTVKISKLSSFFKAPLDSKLLQICFMHNGIRYREKNVKLEQLTRKVLCLPVLDSGFVLYPMLHEVEKAV